MNIPEFLLFANVNLLILGIVCLAIYRKLKFFGINRFLLLIIPAISVAVYFIPKETVPEYITTIQLPAFETGSLAKISTQTIDWKKIIIWTYLTGFVFSFLLFVVRIIRIVYFLRQIPFRHVGDLNVGYTSKKVRSFSFLNYIVVQQKDESDSEHVIAHESLHYQLRHTYDNLFYGLFKAIMWFNPVVYLLHNELRKVHEYQVDARICAPETRENYIAQMIMTNPGFREMILTNPYKSKSNLINRIKMLKKGNPNQIKAMYYLIIMPFVAAVFVLNSCSTDSMQEVKSPESETVENRIVSGEELNDLTVKPSFPGGMSELGSYLGSEIKYPEKAKKEGLSGNVYVSFVIDEHGAVTNPQIKKGIHPLLDKEALRAVAEMPDWKPGMMGDKPVSVEYVLPVVFKI